MKLYRAKPRYFKYSTLNDDNGEEEADADEEQAESFIHLIAFGGFFPSGFGYFLLRFNTSQRIPFDSGVAHARTLALTLNESIEHRGLLLIHPQNLKPKKRKQRTQQQQQKEMLRWMTFATTRTEPAFLWLRIHILIIVGFFAWPAADAPEFVEKQKDLLPLLLCFNGFSWLDHRHTRELKQL